MTTTMIALQAKLEKACTEVTVMKRALGDVQGELQKLKIDRAGEAKDLAEMRKQFEQIKLSLAVGG